MAYHLGHEQPAPANVNSARDDDDRLYAKYEAPKAITHRQNEQESPDVITIHDDILRLIPLNIQARRAFDSVVRLDKDGRLNRTHAQYIQITGTGPLSRILAQAAKESDVTTDEVESDDQSLSSQRTVHEGYFRVRFDLSAVSERPVWVCAMSILFPLSGSRSLFLFSLHAYNLLHYTLLIYTTARILRAGLYYI